MNKLIYDNLNKEKLLNILTGISNSALVIDKKDDDYIAISLQIKEIRYLRDLLKEELEK